MSDLRAPGRPGADDGARAHDRASGAEPVGQNSIFAHLGVDIPAGVVVFLVALPLCLGIALASGAEPLSGMLAGAVGGLVVPLISRSPLSVSGPAAGLTAIVLVGIGDLGFERFLVAVFLGGVLQASLGVARLGDIAVMIPNSVIKGMLAAIGVILILKQLPHAIGYDIEAFGLDAFIVDAKSHENTFSLLLHALSHVEVGAFVISAVSLAILILWPKTPMGQLTWLPAPLLVVVIGTLMNISFPSIKSEWVLQQSHLVTLPDMAGFSDIFARSYGPDWSALTDSAVYMLAVTLALVASLETLLCLEAVDKLDPWHRRSPTNRELIAQGTGNMVAGLIGGLPITSVIVRSSANVSSGGRTRMSALVHGVLIVLSIAFLGTVLNRIPLAALATILLMVGYKLANPKIFRSMWRQGQDQFLPFTVTVVAILLTDLLRGVLIGLAVGIIFILRANMRDAFVSSGDGDEHIIRLAKDVSFLNKLHLRQCIDRIPPGSRVVIDGTQAEFIDRDIRELIAEFAASTTDGVNVRLVGIDVSDVDIDLGGH